MSTPFLSPPPVRPAIVQRQAVVSALVASGLLSPGGNLLLTSLGDSLDLAATNREEFCRLGFSPADITVIFSYITLIASPLSGLTSPSSSQSSLKPSPSPPPPVPAIPSRNSRSFSEIGTELSVLPTLNHDEFQSWLTHRYGVPGEYVQGVTISGRTAFSVRSPSVLELAGVPEDIAAALIHDLTKHRVELAASGVLPQPMGQPWEVADLELWTKDDVKRWLAFLFKSTEEVAHVQSNVNDDTARKLWDVVSAAGGLDEKSVGQQLKERVFPDLPLTHILRIRKAVYSKQFGNRPADKRPSLAMKLMNLRRANQHVSASSSACEPPASVSSIPLVTGPAAQATSDLGKLVSTEGSLVLVRSFTSSLQQLPTAAIHHFFPPFPDHPLRNLPLIDGSHFTVREGRDGAHAMAGMQGATALVLQCSPLPRFDPDLRGVLEAHCPPGDDISFILKFMHNHSDEPDASSIRAQARQFKTEYSTPKHLYKYQASVCILDYFSGDEATFEKYRPVASKDVAHRSKSLCVCEPYYGLSLHDYILQRSLKPDLSAIRGLSCEEWYAMITGVFFCVQSLEREGIAHCDIKPKNVVYSPRFGPLLIDFGGAQVFRAPGSSSGISIDPSQRRLAHMCSPRYCDPYVTAFGSGDCDSPPTTMEGLFGKADAYSAAKSMLDVIFGNTSWEVDIARVMLGSRQFDRLDARVRGLLLGTLDKDVSERPSGNQVFRAMCLFMLCREGFTLNISSATEWLHCERDRLRHLLLNMKPMSATWTNMDWHLFKYRLWYLQDSTPNSVLDDARLLRHSAKLFLP